MTTLKVPEATGPKVNMIDGTLTPTPYGPFQRVINVEFPERAYQIDFHPRVGFYPVDNDNDFPIVVNGIGISGALYFAKVGGSTRWRMNGSNAWGNGTKRDGLTRSAYDKLEAALLPFVESVTQGDFNAALIDSIKWRKEFAISRHRDAIATLDAIEQAWKDLHPTQ